MTGAPDWESRTFQSLYSRPDWLCALHIGMVKISCFYDYDKFYTVVTKSPNPPPGVRYLPAIWLAQLSWQHVQSGCCQLEHFSMQTPGKKIFQLSRNWFFSALFVATMVSIARGWFVWPWTFSMPHLFFVFLWAYVQRKKTYLNCWKFQVNQA